MSNTGKIIRVNALPPVENRENNVIYQVAAPGAATYTDYAIDANGDLKTHAVVEGTVPLELSDNHITVTDQKLKNEEILSQAQYNIDTRERLDQKLEIPLTEGNPQDYPKIIGLNENGGVAKLPAGDLGKNIANASLTSVPGASFTLGASWSMNTFGLPYTITGLSNVSNDSSFNTLLTQNSVGRIGKSNGKQAFLSMPALMTAAEKEQFGLAWSNQYSNSNINVYSITPPIIKHEHTVKYFVLQGLNLNVNPANTSIKFIPEGNALGTGEINCLGFQTFSDGKSMVVTIYGDALSAGLNYNIVIRTSTPVVQVYRTANIITVASLTNNVDLNTIVWTKKIYNNQTNDGVFGNAGSAQYQSDPNVKAYANEATIVSALKSSKIIEANQDFYLNFDVNINFLHPSSTLPYHSVGLMLHSTTLELINSNVASIRILGRADSWARQIFLDNSSISHSQSLVNPEILNYTIMRRGSIVYFVLTRGGTVLNYSKTISSEALSFAMFNTNMSISTNIAFNITELILF